MKIDSILIEAAKRKQLVLVINNEYETQIVQDLNAKFGLVACVEEGLHSVISEIVDLKKATIPEIRDELLVGRKRISGYPNYFKSILEIKDSLRCVIDVSPFTLFMDFLISNKSETGFCFPKNTDENYSYSDGVVPCINLFGDIGNYNDFHLEIDKYEEFIKDSSKSICVGLQDRINGTFLFVGFDPKSSSFEQVIKFLCRKNSIYNFESFLLAKKKGAYSHNERQKLRIIDSEFSEFFSAFLGEIQQLKTHEIAQKTKKLSLASMPYKYLDSFEECDSDIFFGRTSEIDDLAKRIKSQRQVNILVSSSGFGKTSLIKAGIIPKIRSTNEYSIYYARSRANTFDSIIHAIREQNDYINDDFQIKTDSPYQLIIVDQFEEFFVLGDSEKTKELDEKLNKLLQKNPKLKLLIVIREDFISKMIGMTIDPNLSVSMFLLRPFSVEHAKEAISKPAELCGYEFEEGLIDTIVADLLNINDFEERKQPFIDPSQLQVVCFTLVEKLQGAKLITRELYNSFNGAQGILADYIENSFKGFGDGADKEKFRAILKSMVSSSQTKIPVRSKQIIESFKSSDIIETEEKILARLHHLVDARLIRPCSISGDMETYYELTHEYIIKKISEWMDAESIFIKQTQERVKLNCDNANPLRYLFTQALLEDVEKYKCKLYLSEKEKSRILLNVILQKKDDEDFIDSLKFWIERNIANRIFYNELKVILGSNASELIGEKRITACFALYSILGNESECYSFILSILGKHINPHFNKIYEIFIRMGFDIKDEFAKECNKLLEKKRIENMIRIPSCFDIILGLDEKQGEAVIKKYDLPKQLRRNIPSSTRKFNSSEYWVDIFLVTNQDYKEFCETHIYMKGKERFPVVNLSYQEAEEYARWWNKSIPSEDEWEYAARGRDGRYYPWGNEWPFEEEGKFDKESDKHCNTSITGHDGLTEVGFYTKGDSHFKCKDMAGNVWEWTATSPTIGKVRDEKKAIVKGGSWSVFGVHPWAWYQYHYNKCNGYQNVGFRCVYRVSK